MHNVCNCDGLPSDSVSYKLQDYCVFFQNKDFKLAKDVMEKFLSMEEMIAFDPLELKINLDKMDVLVYPLIQWYCNFLSISFLVLYVHRCAHTHTRTHAYAHVG